MLAIAGGKGGAGKTTTALGLAAALDGPVVVADADCDMPNLHALASVDREPTLSDLSGQDVDAVAQSHPTHAEVSLLPAPRLDESDALDRSLARLGATDRPVVVDCPGGAGPDAAAPLRAADEALVVTTLCAPALRDAAKTAAMARTLGTPVRGVVLTRTRSAPDAVSELLGCPVIASVPRAQSPVLDADGVRSAYDRLASALGRESAEALLSV